MSSPYAATTTVSPAPGSSRRAAPAGAPGSPAARRRPSPAAAPSLRPRPRGAVGPRQQVRDVVPGGEPLEHVGAERRRRGDGEPRQATRRTRPRPQDRERLACGLVGRCGRGSARRRDGRARAGRRAPRSPSSSSRTSPPSSSWPSTVTVTLRSTGTSTPCSERQPSSSTSARPRRSTIARVDDARALVVVAPGRRTRAAARRPALPARPTPCASCISADHPLGEPARGRRRTPRPRAPRSRSDRVAGTGGSARARARRRARSSRVERRVVPRPRASARLSSVSAMRASVVALERSAGRRRRPR